MDCLKDITAYLRVTGDCNSNCKFCYRDSRGAYGEDTKILKEEIDKLKSFGFKRISFLGGEIFLRPDIQEIIQYAYNNNLEVCIATNGSLLTEKDIDILNKYVTWVGIPLDGSTKEKSAKIRDSFDQYEVTTSLLKKFKKNTPKFKVRVSTVVTRINKNDLIDLAKLLYESEEIYKPDGWRVLKFLALEEGSKNKDRFLIEDEKFLKVADEVINKYPQYNISYSNSTYIIISAESRLLISKEDKYIDKGDFRKMSKGEFIESIGQDILERTAINSSWRR